MDEMANEGVNDNLLGETGGKMINVQLRFCFKSISAKQKILFKFKR